MAQTSPRRDIADVLIQGKLITNEQAVQAREVAEKTGQPLSKVFEEQFKISSMNVLRAEAYLRQMSAVDLTQRQPDPSCINLVPARVAQLHRVIPVGKVNRNGQDFLVLALSDPNNLPAIDDVQRASGLKVQPVLAPAAQITEMLEKHYGAPVAPVPVESNGGQPAEPVTEDFGLGSITSMIGELDAPDEVASADDESEVVQGPIMRIAHAIIQEAVKAGASDIHMEPGTRHIRIRYRIDGVLHEIMTLPRFIHPPLSSRYKIMAEMNIAERRVPQDGRIGISYQNKDYDLRVSCLPTLVGEKIVMRILDKGSVMIGLNKLGFFPDTLTALERLFTQPNGMLLVTGPTGAGKSTTLYSVLNRINSVERNILTVEDPVEYQLPGISQVAVLRKAGLTFATALRSFMRQDPDVIMVGEIRDLETAEMAIQASLTGHLVLSTLHTNDAPSTVTRLVDMGVEPFLVSATMIGSLAQRLGRRICENCKEEYEGLAADLISIGYKPEGDEMQTVPLWRGRGCDRCRFTGYKGRIGIYELMTINEEAAELVVRRAPVSELRHAARANGMKTLQEDGLRKVLAGITTPEEIARVVFTGGH